jgi:hypothetical protein
MKNNRRRVVNPTMPPYKVIQKSRFEVIDQGIVDGELWRVVQVEPKVAPWIRGQNSEWWYEHMTTQQYRVLDTFDMNEKLYLLTALKWS